jgi:thiosulfate/3-mercaptopyruvate sulfurtransferase
LNDGVTNPLISAEELSERLDEVKLFDLRWSLTEPTRGRISYRSAHLPGAVFVDLDQDLAASQGSGRHPLPPISEFIGTLGRLGVNRDDSVIVYDDVGGAVAARMWWMLRSIGHDDVSLLDGGLQAWTEMGLPLEEGGVEPVPGAYPPVTGYTGVVEHDELEGRALADVRSPERYRGEVEPVDPKAGHIPGAINYPVDGNLNGGRFMDGAGLAERYREFPEAGVVSCGSGVNACHTAIAMVLAGRAMPDIYVGSFSDWSRRDLPVATGPNP